MFMSLFVIYGFDTASTLAEETKDPRRNAPKAVLFSVIGAFIIGGVFLLGVLVAIRITPQAELERIELEGWASLRLRR